MASSVLPRNMLATNDHYQILQMQTCKLKVNIHCEGCKEKVRKILRKIEGVYSVDINAEKQMVKVTGNVETAILISKLAKSGKYAQVWPSRNPHDHNHNQDISSYNNGANYQNQIQNLITSLNTPKSQPLLTPRGLEDQLSYERYLMQNMDMNNQGQMEWDHRSLIGDNGSGFIELDGSQLNGNFYGGLQTYHDRQSSMPMMNTYQQNHSSVPMVMNWNGNNTNMQHGGMGNHVTVHDNMYMHQPQILNHASPVFRQANHAQYY